LARLAPIALVVALLAATAAAFAIAERLKLEKSPITKPRIESLFSPVSEVGTGTADIGFYLRHADTLTISIEDSTGRVVRTLLSGVRRSQGFVHLTWDGRAEAGALVPDGAYRVRVHLAREQRTITIPDSIRVDTVAPRIHVTSARPRVFSPDGDGHSDVLLVHFRLNETARPFILVNGRQRVKGRIVSHGGQLRWFGHANGHGLPAGVYRLSLRAADEAGNLSTATRPILVRIRYVALGQTTYRVAPRHRFRVFVSTDARQVSWLLHGRSGTARHRSFLVPVPARPGSYRLFVAVKTHAASATVVVNR
jgi:hypothetical protein